MSRATWRLSREYTKFKASLGYIYLTVSRGRKEAKYFPLLAKHLLPGKLKFVSSKQKTSMIG